MKPRKKAAQTDNINSGVDSFLSSEMCDYMLSSNGPSMLYQTILSGRFFTLSNEETLQHIHHDFTDELERLKRAYSIRGPNSTFPLTQSPSQFLYSKNYDEINRTLVGVLALRWLYDNDYDSFVGTQPEAVKLKPESFAWMRDLFLPGIRAPADLYALILSIVINDLGKDPQLASDYEKATGEDISGVNHDMILLKAVKIGLVPCLTRLDPRHRADIIRGMELGAEFNFGQLAQAENVPACLSGLLGMRSQAHAFTLRFMEQLLDIAGAAGHMDWTCAKKLIEPVYQAYHNVYDVAIGIIFESMNLRDGYDIILTRRAEVIHKAGFRALSVKKLKERALIRLLCMAGAVNLETANLYDDAFSGLDESRKQSLIKLLNVDGSVANPAVQPTYMPAMLASGLECWKSTEQKKTALQSLLIYLARVLTVKEKPSQPISVIERSVRQTLKHVLESETFKADPTVLETVDIPKDEIAKMGE